MLHKFRVSRLAAHIVGSSVTIAHFQSCQPAHAHQTGKDHVHHPVFPRRQVAAGAGFLSKNEVMSRARGLRSTYAPAYAFPMWTIQQYLGDRFAAFEEDARQCAIFIDEGTTSDVALALASEREPVNIGMKRPYDKSILEELFGWQTGMYGEIAGVDASKLPPNIAIMCRTPVIGGLSGPEQEASQEQLYDPNNKVHILNVIGYAFDNPRQPDQRYFLGDESTISNEKRLELKSRFAAIFDKIFAAALHYKLEVIVLAKFGAGAFSENYPGDMNKEIWLPAFEASFNAWAKRLQEGGVKEISLMGGDNDLVSTIKGKGFTCETYTFFPDPIRAQLGEKLRKAMLVNAWDSWSCIGNGNFADRSLDGFMGRATAMAILGWPLTNPCLADRIIQVVPPVYSIGKK
eukprot:gnl/MRDRNA2_/MRDRNA2_68992_c0_seq1.p1 gnl/MRDRNA2_/MRDRNA2_68992_c0~~gnl/MRDRNA2_/MRDRNA2_68992_c0_seq1.p1  ORF type:complete len:403 (+),score=83.17 gnl/MRDRNA2_/MRDRNA2_68992_c0_seq1:63-1271(+)